MTLSIGGYKYTISCPEGQEQRVLDLASYVDSRVGEIKSSGAAGGEAHPLALAALMLADEAMENKQNAGDKAYETAPTHAPAPQDNSKTIAALAEIAGQIRNIADRLKSF